MLLRIFWQIFWHRASNVRAFIKTFFFFCREKIADNESLLLFIITILLFIITVLLFIIIYYYKINYFSPTNHQRSEDQSPDHKRRSSSKKEKRSSCIKKNKQREFYYYYYYYYYYFFFWPPIWEIYLKKKKTIWLQRDNRIIFSQLHKINTMNIICKNSRDHHFYSNVTIPWVIAQNYAKKKNGKVLFWCQKKNKYTHTTHRTHKTKKAFLPPRHSQIHSFNKTRVGVCVCLI